MLTPAEPTKKSDVRSRIPSFPRSPFPSSDVLLFGAEVPPRTASQVIDLDSYRWRDEEWMATRAARNAEKVRARQRDARAFAARGGRRGCDGCLRQVPR